jgi:hypothetical protein
MAVFFMFGTFGTINGDVEVSTYIGNAISRDAVCFAARRMGFMAVVAGSSVRVRGPVNLNHMKELARQAAKAERGLRLSREMKVNRRLRHLLTNA